MFKQILTALPLFSALILLSFSTPFIKAAEIETSQFLAELKTWAKELNQEDGIIASKFIAMAQPSKSWTETLNEMVPNFLTIYQQFVNTHKTYKNFLTAVVAQNNTQNSKNINIPSIIFNIFINNFIKIESGLNNLANVNISLFVNHLSNLKNNNGVVTVSAPIWDNVVSTLNFMGQQFLNFESDANNLIQELIDSFFSIEDTSFVTGLFDNIGFTRILLSLANTAEMCVKEFGNIGNSFVKFAQSLKTNAILQNNGDLHIDSDKFVEITRVAAIDLGTSYKALSVYINELVKTINKAL